MCDFSSLSQLIRESQGHLLRYAEHFLHNPQSAQDIVQQAYIRYIRFVRKSGGVFAADNLKAWLLKTVRNLCLDELKKASFRLETSWQHLDFDLLASRIIDWPGTDLKNPDERMALKDEIIEIRKIIKTLPEQEQEVLALKFEENKSYAEIAEITGFSKGYVGFLLHNAIAGIKEKYRILERKDQNK